MKNKKICISITLMLFMLCLLKTISFSNTIAEKTKVNGIYKIVLGVDSSKSIEVTGGDTNNNAKIDIGTYRKCTIPKAIFKL